MEINFIHLMRIMKNNLINLMMIKFMKSIKKMNQTTNQINLI